MEGRPLDERELVTGAQRGDVRAYEELLRLYSQIAYRTAYLVLGSAEDAEDACQEAFLKAHGALGRFRSGTPFRPWLLQIVANEARNRRRSAGRRLRLLTRAAVVLVVLLGGQLFLGSEAWLARFRTAYPNRIEVRPLLASRGATFSEEGWTAFFRAVFTDPGFVRSLHFLVGALLFALVVSMTLYAFRGLGQFAGHQPAPAPHLEEAA